MKIALNIEWIGARRGGAEKYAGSLARALVASGHDVHLFVRGVDDDEIPPHVPIHEIHLTNRFCAGWMRTYRFAAASARVLHRESFDLVIGFNKTWHQDVLLAVAGAHPAIVKYGLRKFRNPVQRHLHALGKLLSPKQWLFRRIERKQFRTPNRPQIVAPSEFAEKQFRDYHGLPPLQVSIVYNGLDFARSDRPGTPSRGEFRARYGLVESDFAILFTARKYDLKGLEPLMEAFAVAAASRPRLKLVVCGNRHDAPYRRMARRLGVEGRVVFLGFVEDIRGCYTGCDLFAFPTFFDPCSLVVLEAMHAGLPAITSGYNGGAELIVHGETGFVVEDPWNIRGWSDHIGLLHDDETLRRRVAVLAHERVKQFSIDVRLKELLSVLEKLAPNKSVRDSTSRNAA